MFAAGALGLAGGHDVQQPMVGHEGAVQQHVVAARTRQTHHVPGVFNGVLVGQQQGKILLRGLALLRDHDEEDASLAMVHIAGKAPAATHLVAALDALQLHFGGQEGAGDGAIGRLAPQIRLRLCGEHAENPGMAGGDAIGPGAGDAVAGDLRRDLSVGAIGQLVATVLAGLQGPVEARRAKVRLGGLWNMAQALGLRSPGAQGGAKSAGALDQDLLQLRRLRVQNRSRRSVDRRHHVHRLSPPCSDRETSRIFTPQQSKFKQAYDFSVKARRAEENRRQMGRQLRHPLGGIALPIERPP